VDDANSSVVLERKLMELDVGLVGDVGVQNSGGGFYINDYLCQSFPCALTKHHAMKTYWGVEV
jgi:hypothetical protein